MQKLVKKRKQKETDSENITDTTEAKRKKDEFTEIDFKLMLRDPNQIFAGIEKFIEASRRYPDEEYNIILKYCQSSNDCSEIFHLFDATKRKASEVALIFNALECILIRIADDLDTLKAVGQVVVQRLVSSHLPLVSFSLRMSNKSTQIKAALKLLTAMVMVGGSSCKAVISQFNFTHQNIPPLFNRRDRKDEQDVRTCLVHFVMSFLLVGDGTVIRRLVEQKTMLKGILRGLSVDKLSTIQLVIPTILEKVIQYSSVSKTLKVQLFSDSILKQLSSMYYWKGPGSWKDKNTTELLKNEEKPDDEDSQHVAQMVHTLFLELCCSFKNGICFFDKTFGTSGKNQNSLLTKLFTSLSKSLDNPLCDELIAKFLFTCPDQLQYFFSSLKSSFTPRPSTTWNSCMDFLIKVYTTQPELPPVLSHCEGITAQKLAAMLAVFIIPPEKVFHSLCLSLKHKSAFVRHKMLELLKLIVHRATGVFRHCAAAPRSSTMDKNYWNNVIENFRHSLLKCLPDGSELFACWKQMSSTENETTVLDKELPLIDPLDHLILLEQVSCLYQNLYPSLLIDNHQYLTLLLDSIREHGGDNSSVDDEKQVLPELYLLKMLAGTDARKLPWTKTLKDGHTLMYLLLDMMCQMQHNEQLKQMTQRLICRLLVSTNLFESTERELEIWFQHFTKQLALDESSDILKFMAQVLTTFISNPFPYVDKVTELLADSGSQLDHSGDTRSIGTAESAIDAILEMDEDELLLLKNSDTNDLTTSSSSPRLPFSPVVLVSLEVLEASDEFKTSIALQDLLCAVFIDILHTQLDPVPLSELLAQHLTALGDRSEILYVTTWSPNTRAAKWKSNDGRPSQSVSELLMSLQAGDFVLDAKFERRLSTTVCHLTAQNSVNVVQQILLHMRKIFDNFEQMDEKGPVLLKMLFNILRNIKENLMKLTTNKKESGKDSEMSEFDMLDAAEITADEAMVDVLKIVLYHPYMQKWFLFNRDLLNSSAMTPDSERLLSQLVTQQLVQLLDGLPSALFTGVRSHLQTYCKKTDHTLEMIRKGKVPMCEFSLVLKCVAVFVKCVDFEYQSRFLNNLLNFHINHLINHGKVKKLSKAGKLVIQLASATMSDKKQLIAQGKELSLTKMATIFDLLTVSSDSFLEDYCCQALQNESSYAVVVSKDLLYALLKELSDSRIQIIQHVLVHNVACRFWFQRWIIQNDVLLKKNKLILAKPVQVYLMMLKQTDEHNEQNMKDCLEVIRRVYMKNKVNFVTQSSLYLTISHLLMQIKAVDNTAMLDYWKLLTSAAKSKSSLTFEHLELILFVHQTLGQSHQSCDTQQVILLLMKILMNSCAQKDDRNNKFEDDVMSLIKQLLESVSSLEKEIVAMWSQFVKVSLKCLYLNPKLLRILSQLLPLVYTESCDISLPIKSLHEMAMSHSQFLPVMFGDNGEEIKESLVSLLVELVERCPKCSSSSHCALLLGSYTGSLSIADQKIIKLMYLYEQQGNWMKDHRPFLWGPKAVEHYSARSNLGLSLWKHPSMEQTIDNLDVQKMYRSILHFPLRRTIVPDSVDSAKNLQSKPDVYDPCFLLPLFSILLSPDSVVNCRKFIELHCLGYTFAALSSHTPDVRRAAYHVLAEFYPHLEASDMFERVQVTCILDLLRNSCQEMNVKLACIITVFLAKAARLQLNIEDQMYRVINSFLLVKPDLDLANVPEFYKLFRSSVLQFKEDRSWILSLLVDGLRDSADYRVMERRFTFKILQTFHDSALADSQCQLQVLKIIKSACSVRTVASDLVKTHGLVTWLNAVILSMRADKISLISEIVHTLWFTLLVQWSTTDVSTSSDNQHVLPLKLSREILLCVKSFMQNCGRCNMRVWLQLLEVMVSTIQNINTIMGRIHAQGHLITSETLNLKDVCFILLHSGRHLHQDDIVTYTTQILNSLGYEPKPVMQESSKPYTNRLKSNRPVSDDVIVDDEQKPGSEDKKRISEKEKLDIIEDKEKVTEDQLLMKTVEVVLFWNPDDGHSLTQDHTVAGILMSASVCLRSTHLKDRSLIYRFLQWIEKYVSAKTNISKMCVDTLLSGSHFAVGVLNGMLEVYKSVLSTEKDGSLKVGGEGVRGNSSSCTEKDGSLKVGDEGVRDNSSSCLGVLNSVVLSLMESAAVASCDWRELTDHAAKWKNKTSVHAQEWLSLVTREFLMESRLKSPPKPTLQWSVVSDYITSLDENTDVTEVKSHTTEKNPSEPETDGDAEMASNNNDPEDDPIQAEENYDAKITSGSESESDESMDQNLTKLRRKVYTKRKPKSVAKKKKRKDMIISNGSHKFAKPLLKVLKKQTKLHSLR